MKQTILILLSCICLFDQLKGQDDQEDSSYTSMADRLFQHLDKRPIRTGILYDRVFPSASLDIFNTGEMDTSDVGHWSQAYSELFNSAYSNAAWITPESLEDKISQLRSNNVVPIGIINYRFNQIDTDAIEKKLIVERQELFYDVPGRPENPYWIKEVSVIAALTGSVPGLKVNFQTRRDLFLHNTRHSISTLQVDFGNGAGFRRIALNDKFTVNYKTYGNKVIKFLITYSDGSKVTTYSALNVTNNNGSATALASLPSSCDRDDYITATTAFNDYENQNFKGQGNYHYFFATNHPCNGKVYKPLIIVDGIDYKDEIHVDSLYKLLGNGGIGDSLRSWGYDIVILNFPTYTNELGKTVHGGADFIERNAMVLVALMDRLNQEIKDNGSTEKMVLLGPSMGGLVTQYALAYMEKENIPHNTRLWISLDAPHNGANIPIGIQYFLRFLEHDNSDAKKGLEIINSSASRQMLLHHYKANSSVAQGAPNYRDRFAQALANNGVPGSNGFPLVPRKIALVDGSLSGASQKNLTACERAFRVKGYLTIKTFLFKVKIKVADISIFYSGSYNNSCRVLDGWYGSETNIRIRNEIDRGTAPSNTISYDIAPGSKRYTLQSLAGQSYSPVFNLGIKEREGYLLTLLFPVLAFIPRSAREKFDYDIGDSIHCFIPTKSALAFKGINLDLAENVYLRDLVCTGETPFDSYFGDTQNHEHVEVHSQMGAFVLGEINGIHRQPASGVNLGSDTIRLSYKDACTTLSIKNLSSADAGSYRFIWSTGDTTPGITVCPKQTTTYSITVSTGSCTTSGKITVQVLPRCNEDLIVDAPSCTDDVKILWTEPTDTFPNVIAIPQSSDPSDGKSSYLSYLGSFNGHGYYESNHTYMWPVAQRIAQTVGGSGLNGHLVTIGSARENEFVFNRIKRKGHWSWIGLSNTGRPGSFRWVTNEILGYTNWARREPNNLGGSLIRVAEPYVHIYGDDGTWNDWVNNSLTFIAEFEKPLIQFRQISGPKNGSEQKVGEYTVCYERTSFSTNQKDTCCFSVVVKCNEKLGSTVVTRTGEENEAIKKENKTIKTSKLLKAVIYPNPSSNEFRLNITSLDLKERANLRIVDALGRLIETKTGIAPNQTLQIGNNLRPGVYFVKVMQGTSSLVSKVVKEPK